MKVKNQFKLKLKGMFLLLVCLPLFACNGSKTDTKGLLEQAVSDIREGYEDGVKDYESAGDSGDAMDALELPVYTKGTLSETVKKRYSYTLSYNHDTKNPNWVAWTITSAHASGSVQRMDFMDDEDMPAPKGYLSDYYNSGYDRGHMCPAGDNKWSEKAMADCFLITNMCPQNNNLNRGVWNSIEQQCRSWAKKYGKVYVVCGPVYLNQQHRKIGKNKVVVPEAFFKVVLRMGKNPQAIGFICRNVSQKGKKKTDFINSVDEVERITGYDFFSKLPDDIENKVEARADINEW